MPPNDSEFLVVQSELFSRELANKVADAELILQTMEERARGEGRTLTNDERLKVLNAPGYEMIATGGAKLRFFFNHLPQDEWDAFRRALAKAKINESSPELEHLTDLYHAFCKEFDSFVQEWVGTLDPEVVTSLTDALDHIDDDESLATVRSITESLVDQLARRVDRKEE